MLFSGDFENEKLPRNVFFFGKQTSRESKRTRIIQKIYRMLIKNARQMNFPKSKVTTVLFPFIISYDKNVFPI